jgi:prolyl oligopeptidase
VRRWSRGTNPAQAPIIFTTDANNLLAWVGVDRTVAPQRLLFMDKPSFFDQRFWLGDLSGAKHKLELPTDAAVDLHGQWLLIKSRTPWTNDGQSVPADCLLAIQLDCFLAGSREYSILFEPTARCALQSYTWANDSLIINSLDELKPCFDVHTPSVEGWIKRPLLGVAKTGVVSIGTLDLEAAESNGDLLVTSEDPLTPPTQSLIEFGRAPTVLNRVSAAFDPKHLVVTQHEAVSVDGERIPYTQVGPAKATGDAPVHMVGYGGFQVTERPYYATAIGKLWLERGGTHVITNIRGGGEFGTRWHEAGRREKKRLSHDDFAAIASDLVARGVTTPARVAAEGGSNGGILISNMLTRYPQRFGALFCTIPLIDMRRYSKLLAGASWIGEYGDPDLEADWAYLQHYSAYHNVEAGKTYPPILVATTRKDDRVHPGHARKFAAKLQALGHDQTAYFELAAGGHGYGKDNAERAMFTTLGLTFLARKIGWDWPE